MRPEAPTLNKCWAATVFELSDIPALPKNSSSCIVDNCVNQIGLDPVLSEVVREVLEIRPGIRESGLSELRMLWEQRPLATYGLLEELRNDFCKTSRHSSG